MERLLEAERAQLPNWLVVGFGGGIAGWFALDSQRHWTALLCITAALAVAGFMLGSGRTGRALGCFALAMNVGCALAWARGEWVAAPRLERPQVVTFDSRIERVEVLVARGNVRVTVAPADRSLPPRVRVSIPEEDAPDGLKPGATLRMRARLVPPPPMPLPGAHDFARDAWFKGIGAVGKTLGPVKVLTGGSGQTLDDVRARLGQHIRNQLPVADGGVAIALATGDQHAVGKDDAEAMRRAGLIYLLVVSGLHVAAVIGATMLLTLKLLALSERLALRFNLVLVAAGAGALAGIGYTLLTGMQVPTIRSCIAALLVLAGIALGREAISLRLLAVAAFALLVVTPETLVGASFQMSFAAVGAIIALYSTGWARRHLTRRGEGRFARLGRGIMSLFATGLAVQIALIPISLYHFHRTGLYGIGASLIALPLTTLVIMPLEAAALFLDIAGLGAPAWYLCRKAIDLLLWIAHEVGTARGAVQMLPSMPGWAFGLMIAGGLWLCLWNTRLRLLGLVPLLVGAAAAALAPSPDLLVTGDGRHLAVVENGTPLLLRDRAGDFVRSLLAEASGFDGDPDSLGSRPYSACSPDSCVALMRRGARQWRLLATRSNYRIDWADVTRACAQADIVVSDRRLPRGCTPRWLKLDAPALASMGGVTVYLGDGPRIETVAERVGEHPWAQRLTNDRSTRRSRFRRDRRSGTAVRRES